MLTVGSLFSGIGGFDLGLERAGMRIEWQVEIDPWCQAFLMAERPSIPVYGDIKQIDWETVRPVDLVCGGFPCQPVSVAGKRLAQDDPRWLWPEFLRCLRILRPRYALIENVPGLFTAGFTDVLSGLASCGYDAEWDCLSAGACGAHFRRDRVFIIAGCPFASGVRWEGIRTYQNRTWSEQQFARLVEYELSVCVPAGKDQRVSDGLPNRIHRLRAIGNSVVPQVAEVLGRMISELDAQGREYDGERYTT